MRACVCMYVRGAGKSEVSTCSVKATWPRERAVREAGVPMVRPSVSRASSAVAASHILNAHARDSQGSSTPEQRRRMGILGPLTAAAARSSVPEPGACVHVSRTPAKRDPKCCTMRGTGQHVTMQATADALLCRRRLSIHLE